MKSNYLIKVKSVNVVEGDKTESEIITHADFELLESGYTIVYKEEKGETDEETHITVTDGRRVDIKRFAEIETEMTIEEGIRHISYHRLPFGEFSLDVVGKKIASSLSNDGVSLYFSYATFSGGEALGKAEFDITVRRKGRISKEFLRED